MADMKEPEIIRWDTFTVISADTNQYGDLVAVDENGKEHKIKAKRDWLWNMFTPGTVVSAGIASYMNREYIAAAKISEGVFAVVKEAIKEGGVVTGVTQKPRESGQELGMLLKELGENIRTGTLTRDKIAGDDSKGALLLFKFYWKHLNDRIKYYGNLETGE